MTAPEDTAATLRRAYTTMQRLRRDLEAHERARTEPIAVVGLGCRFPGGAVDGDSYWDLLASGTDAVREIPPDRWDVDAFFSAEPRPGKVSTRSGGFLDRVDAFDHDFFGISRREALAMDPQQRLTLEVVWEALEDSGRAPTRLAGSRTGVFMGVSSFDYATEHLLDPVDFSAHAGTGVAHSVVTGRVSYTLDLRGPSMAIDTACSSALVAVHQACQSLRLGESDLAVAGGVNVVLSPLPSVSFSQFGRMVSVDGRCKAFDASANGYVRSEGCGAVVLKRLSDAERDGDRVLAVIRGAAVNQDGRSAGVTAPNGSAQREVLRQALAAAGVGPDEVTFVEAHGTGTRLGDPIEVEALAEVYGRPAGPPLHLGSSKTNIGHAEAAAGIAGLIKVVLALHKGAIPGNVHFRRLNPDISFAGTTFTVPTALTPWPETGGPRTAGVSSFGFSGTNAHVILQQAPERAAPAEADDRRPRSVLALSAKSPTALTALAARYRDRFATAAEPVADLCYSANTGRSAFAHRLAVTGGTAGEVAERLAAFAEGVVADGVAAGRAGSAGEVVFLFTGQGVQRVDMARGLYETQPTFRAAVDECDAVLRPMLERPLLSVLYPDGGDRDLINRTAYAQPAVFAVEYALARLWQSWGVRPAAVLGHSFGEYVAACVAGAMSMEDGLALTVVRSRLMQTLSGTGAMASVAAPELVVAEELAAHPGRISVAAVNGPTATTISGDGELVDAVCAAFTARGIRAKRLHITTASHSPLVEPILDELRAAAERITFSPPVIPLVSNVTGELWPWDQAPDADYWCRHARQPVRFATGVATLRALGHRAFVEVGPTATLLGLVNDMLPAEDEAVLVPSLRPGRDDWQSLLAGVALLHTRGGDIDWAGFDADYTRTRVPVPTYAFDPTPSRRPPRRRGGPVPAAEERADGSEEFADEALPHRLVWRRSTAPAVADGVRRAWLVLADAGGVGDAVAAHAARRGERSVVVVAGERYRHDGDRATVRRDHPEDLTRLLGGLDVGDDEVTVVHLWGLDAGAAGPDDLLDAERDACADAVHAVRALVGAAVPARLWLVTRGAVALDGEVPGVSGSTLWGLGRSVRQEHSGIWGGLLDLDPAATPDTAAGALLDEIGRGPGEDQVALRDGQRHLARLVRAEGVEPAGAAGFDWRPDGTYLITGGLGGLGLAVARSAVLAGARRLVLLGRTPLPPRGRWAELSDDPRVAAVRELESLGAAVHLESLDIADADRVREFLDRHEREGRPPIRGVVHAAGVGDVVPLPELTAEVLDWHLRPKALGAWVLHRCLGERDLDFFVLFSSTSAVLGSPFFSAYAAANAFLDALAHLRRAHGRPAVSVNWGIWRDTGLAAREAEATPGLSRGMGTLTPAQALRAFHRLPAHDVAQLAVIPVDWEEWGRRYQQVSGSALLAELVDAPAGEPRPVARRARVLPTRDELAALPTAERAPLLTARLALSLAATLGSRTPPDPDQPLFDLGVDSLMAVELKNEIEGALGVSLPISAFLDGATARDLVDRITGHLADSGGDRPDDGPIRRVERVEDAAARLLAELARMPDDPGSTNPDTNDSGTNGPVRNRPGTSGPGSGIRGPDGPGSANGGPDGPGSGTRGANVPGSRNGGSTSPGPDVPGTNGTGPTAATAAPTGERS